MKPKYKQIYEALQRYFPTIKVYNYSRVGPLSYMPKYTKAPVTYIFSPRLKFYTDRYPFCILRADYFITLDLIRDETPPNFEKDIFQDLAPITYNTIQIRYVA